MPGFVPGLFFMLMRRIASQQGKALRDVLVELIQRAE